MCTCPRDQLCADCLDRLIAQLRGLAAARGIWWAESVARRVPRDRPWPSHEGRAAEIARGKVADVASDPRLVERLAAELAHHAARRWEQLGGSGPLPA